MNFQPASIYHIYNKGNRNQNIFFNRNNYIYFLEKVHRYFVPHTDILCWCLMPNHFHFLVNTSEQSCILTENSRLPIQRLTEGIRILLSSYTKGIQKQQHFKGNLFQQKTKAKLVSGGSSSYGFTAFNYIHQNPYNAGLVQKMEDWEFSSFRDYTGARNGGLCNIQLAADLLELDMAHFYETSYRVMSNSDVEEIF